MAFFHGSHDFMLQTPCKDDESNHPSTSAILHQSFHNNPHEFLGSIASSSSHMVKQQRVPQFIISDMFHNAAAAAALDRAETNHVIADDELSDDGSQLGGGEKKRRLNVDQVRALEKSFELGNKLEPERKMQLSRALGLQPRQIAIWFQNRRARWKNKQLEKDYDVLKRQFDAVKAENEALHAESQRLHSEILALKTREPKESINLNKETEGSCSNRSESSSDIIRFDIPRKKTTAAAANNNTDQHPNGPLLFPSLLIGEQPNDNNNGGEQQILLRTDQDHHHHAVKEESSPSLMCNNMLCSAGVVDDQSGLWPWMDRPHHYN